MALQKPLQPGSIDEESDGALDDEEYNEDDYPSSSPEKKQLTAKALLESGIVGMWKDRTDIGDTLEYVQRMKDQRRERRQECLRKHTEDPPSASPR